MYYGITFKPTLVSIMKHLSIQSIGKYTEIAHTKSFKKQTHRI